MIDYLPILSTLVAAAFFVVLRRHWQRSRSSHLLWWTIGVGLYGLGTLTEAVTTIFGWNETVFRAWYISGALLGGAPLAQGTVYLLMPKRRADRLTILLMTYVAVAAAFVLTTPVDAAVAAEAGRLTGRVMEWGWVRLFSPLVNLYALVFLVGGAAWSAVRYARQSDGPRARVVGNALIAVGALLPGIGGTFTRAGYVEVLYATELVGILLIWAGYRFIVRDDSRSIHAVQRRALADA